MDARSHPRGSPAGTGRESAPGCAVRDPRARRAAPAGDKGAARGDGAQGGTPGAEPAGTHLRGGPAALLVEQEGGGQQEPDAEPGPHGGAPGAAWTGGGRRGPAPGLLGAAAGGSLSQGRDSSAAHRPGRGSSRRRPERDQASSPICWRCPSPQRRGAGGASKGEDPSARVRGGRSARPGDCGRRAPGRRAPRSVPTAAAARPAPRARRPGGAPRADARARGRPGEAERAAALLVPQAALLEGGDARAAATEAGPEVRAALGRRAPGGGQRLARPVQLGLRARLSECEVGEDGAAAAERPHPGLGGQPAAPSPASSRGDSRSPPARGGDAPRFPLSRRRRRAATRLPPQPG